MTLLVPSLFTSDAPAPLKGEPDSGVGSNKHALIPASFCHAVLTFLHVYALKTQNDYGWPILKKPHRHLDKTALRGFGDVRGRDAFFSSASSESDLAENGLENYGHALIPIEHYQKYD